MTASYQVIDSQPRFRGRVVAVRSDRVAMPGGGDAVRDVVEHPGAVGVVAVDADGRVLLVRQYRHPVRAQLWELPAGLLDQPGEPAQTAAARELAEEAGLQARRWRVLVDGLTSPGMTDEAVRIYLAEELAPVARDAGADEEAELVSAWVPLAEAVRRVLAGEVRNLMACAGLLALAALRAGGVEPRPADSAWPDRPDR